MKEMKGEERREEETERKNRASRPTQVSHSQLHSGGLLEVVAEAEVSLCWEGMAVLVVAASAALAPAVLVFAGPASAE